MGEKREVESANASPFIGGRRHCEEKKLHGTRQRDGNLQLDTVHTAKLPTLYTHFFPFFFFFFLYL